MTDQPPPGASGWWDAEDAQADPTGHVYDWPDRVTGRQFPADGSLSMVRYDRALTGSEIRSVDRYLIRRWVPWWRRPLVRLHRLVRSLRRHP